MVKWGRFRPGIHQGPSVIGIIKNQVRLAMTSKKEYIFIAGLYTLIQSIVVGIFMVHAAIANNPQGDFYTESGVVWGEIATVFVSWFVGSAVFCSAIFALVFFIKYITRK